VHVLSDTQKRIRDAGKKRPNLQNWATVEFLVVVIAMPLSGLFSVRVIFRKKAL
jgi:hypothetical protein